MLTPLNKILLAVIVAISLGFAWFVVFKEHQMATMQTQIQNSVVAIQQLQDNITRSQAQLATKADITAIAQENQINLDAIQQNLNSLNATISSINVVNANTPGENITGQPSTSVTPNPAPSTPSSGTTVNCNGQQIPCPNQDPNGYLSSTQTFSLNEPLGTNTSVPFGQVSFQGSTKQPWSLQVYPRQYNVVNVMGTDQNERHYVYNKFTISENGKDYPLTITKAQYSEEYPQASLSWFNPRVFAGIDSNIGISHTPLKGEVTPNIGLGLISYGQSTVNPEFWFGQVGIGYDVVSQHPQISISPVQYNIGQSISTKLIQNTYLGPNVSIGTDGNIGVGLGLRIGF